MQLMGKTLIFSNILSENKYLRFLVVFILYVTQGVPVGLFFYAIPAWLVASGASALDIGSFLAMTSLPWSLKFVNGFLMDRYTFLPMGKRRIWLIGSQLVMVSCLIGFAFVNPLPTEILLLSIFSFVVNFATSFQDVAIDSMAVDLIPDNEKAQANGFMMGGQSIGIAIGAAFSGMGLAKIGFSGTVSYIAAFIATITMVIILVRERREERLLPWTAGNSAAINLETKAAAWLPLLKATGSALLSKPSILIALALLCSQIIGGIRDGMLPLIAINNAGWTSQGLSSLLGVASLTTGISGIVVFGILVSWLGLNKAAKTGFLFLAVMCLIMIILQPFWHEDLFIQLFPFLLYAGEIFVRIALFAIAMNLCSLTVAATQFTIYMAFSNLGLTLGAATLNSLEQAGGYQAMMIAMALVAFIGFIVLHFIKESPDTSKEAKGYSEGV